MRRVLIITRREILDKKLLFLGAAMCALIVLLSPFLPGVGKDDPVQVMTIGSLALAFLFVAATAIFLGVGIISRDLAERRMSFYLARPVGLFSIWFGKALAVILIALGIGFVLVLIPTLLGGGLFSLDTFVTDLRQTSTLMHFLFYEPLPNLILLTLLLTTLSLFLGLGMRARTPWLGLDFAVAAGVLGVLWISLTPFVLSGAASTATHLALIAAGASILTLAVANFLGFHRGRSDVQVTHKWTSIATAALLLASTTAVAAYAYTVRSFGVDELRYASPIDADDESGWMMIGGRREADWNAYWRTFLIHTRTGNTFPIPDALFGDHGTIRGEIALYWRVKEIEPRRIELVRLDLETFRIEELQFTTLANLLNDFVISPGGERAAFVVDDQLQVIEPGSGRSLFSARLPQKGRRTSWTRLRFESPTRLWAYVRTDGWTIFRIDLVEKRIEPTGELPEGGFYFAGDFLRFFRRDHPRELRRPDNGELVAVLEEGTFALFDGRLARIETDGRTTLTLSRPGETESQSVTLPTRGRLMWLAEPSPSSLLVTLGPFEKPRTFFVNVETGEVNTIERGHPYRQWFWNHPRIAFPGSIGSRLMTADGELFLLDPDTIASQRLTGSD